MILYKFGNIMIARMISGVIGLLMLSSALRWILDPASAAAGLAMVLVEGPGNTTMGMNTQIGDFTAFFFTAGLMACIGALRNVVEKIYKQLKSNLYKNIKTLISSLNKYLNLKVQK